MHISYPKWVFCGISCCLVVVTLVVLEACWWTSTLHYLKFSSVKQLSIIDWLGCQVNAAADPNVNPLRLALTCCWDYLQEKESIQVRNCRGWFKPYRAEITELFLNNMIFIDKRSSISPLYLCGMQSFGLRRSRNFDCSRLSLDREILRGRSFGGRVAVPPSPSIGTHSFSHWTYCSSNCLCYLTIIFCWSKLTSLGVVYQAQVDMNYALGHC